MLKGRLILEAGLAVVLAVSSLVAVSTNDNFKAGVSAAVEGGADLAARTKAAVTSTIGDFAAGIQGNLQAVTQANSGVDASLEGGAEAESQGSFSLSFGGEGDTSAAAEASAQGSVKADFEETLQAMFNTFGFNFQTLFGLDFGS